MVARKRLEVDLRDGSGRVVKFDAPVNATPTQIGVLAMRAIKAAHPQETFQRPRLDRTVSNQAKAFDASASVTPDTLRGRAGNKARDIARGVGFSREGANRIASRTEGAIDYVPLAGDAVSADEAARAFKRGDYGEAALGAGATAIGLIPGLGDAAAPAVKAMFLGVKAKTADKAALAVAEQMAAAGADRKAIWDATGWFKGVDKKWRFEISDEPLRLLKGNVPGPREFSRPLSDAVQHPDLAQAYDLSRLEVGGLSKADRARGAFQPRRGKISLSKNYSAEEMRSTSAHELQHFVQDQEGFAGGGTLGTVNSIPEGETYEKAVEFRDFVRAKANDESLPERERDHYRKQIPAMEAQVERSAQIEGYRRIAGEVEARNVQTRLGGSMEQRRSKPPWETQDVADEDQFVVWGGDAADASDDPLAANWAPTREAKATAKQLAAMPGGPMKNITPRKVQGLSEDYLRQVEQGASGADWYQQSGRAIMSHAGDVEPQAVRLAGGIGVTSANTGVLPNLEHGVRGHWQHAMGEPVRTGQYPTAMGADITKIYDAPDMSLDQLRAMGDEAFGPKRTPFIQQNLMYEGVDEDHMSSARAVHDIWDMRARGYTNPNGTPFAGTPGAATHRWADLQDQGYLLPEANRRELGGRQDWDTGRAQAAAWVGNKIDSLVAKGMDPAEARTIAETDYSHGFDRLYANHSWESAPGSNTGHMSGFDDLPWERRAMYHDDTKQAFLDSEGRSRIALGYNGLSGKSYDTTGLYEGVMSPGTQDRIPVARGTGSQGLDTASEKGMNAIAATQGLLGAQKGAAWNYQSPVTSTWKGATGVNFDMGRTLTPEDIERYGPQILERFPAGNVGLLPDANGMRLAKFWDEPGDDLGGFAQELRRQDPSLSNARPTTQSGNYMENAWDAPEGRFGGQYVDQLRSLDIPQIGQKFDSFAPQIAQRIVTDIDPRMIRDAGLEGSADMERLRKTIANEGWSGLVRLIESTRGSAQAKTALLAGVAGIAGISLMPDDPNRMATDF